MLLNNSDEYYMKIALEEAKRAFDKDEVPIGAIIVLNDKIIAKAHNLTETLNDPTAHAEMLAISSANQYLGSKFLNNAKLYVTLEPCIMCAGAIFWSRITNLIFGSYDVKMGFSKFENIVNTNKLSFLHPKLNIKNGVCELESTELLKSFFSKKRKF
jgi:tRNA(adenine34) deaminase